MKFSVAFAALAAIVTSYSLATKAAEPDTAAANSIVVRAVSGSPLGTSAEARRLIAKVEREGSIRVIAELAVPMRDESSLSPAAAAAQTEALSRAQSGLVERVLGGNRRGVKTFDVVPYVAMTVSPEQLARLLADPTVTAVQEDALAAPMLAESVPLIRADRVWSSGSDGRKQIIAILDTGVEKTHPAIGAAKVVSEACYSTTSRGDVSICPSGLITGPGSGVNCPLTISGCDHGTYVASIAAGNKTSSPPLKGVAPGAQIIAIQVFSKTSAGSVKSYTSDQMLALQRVLQLKDSFGARRIVAVNLSLGSGRYKDYCDGDFRQTLIEQLRAAGIATIVAAGNDGYDEFITEPACIPGVIAVGSSQKSDDAVSPFSNQSGFVHLLAPGDAITAAQAGGLFGAKSGTSMATPHVAGAWALLRQVRPGATVSEILSALTCNAKLLQRGNIFTPRIDLQKARNELLAVDKVQNFTFDQASKDWKPVIGTWRTNGGTYRSINFVDSVVASHSYCRSSLRVVAKMKRIDPSSYKIGAALILASSIAKYGTDAKISGYALAYDQGHDIYPPTVYAFRFVDQVVYGNGPDHGDGTAGQSESVCNGSSELPINIGGNNTLRIDAEDSTIGFYVNGELLCTVSERIFPTAKVAIVAEAPLNDVGDKIFLDSVSIRPLPVPTVGKQSTQPGLRPASDF